MSSYTPSSYTPNPMQCESHTSSTHASRPAQYIDPSDAATRVRLLAFKFPIPSRDEGPCSQTLPARSSHGWDRQSSTLTAYRRLSSPPPTPPARTVDRGIERLYIPTHPYGSIQALLRKPSPATTPLPRAGGESFGSMQEISSKIRAGRAVFMGLCGIGLAIIGMAAIVLLLLAHLVLHDTAYL
ncbi:hypothetical protein AAF712_006085 [Marasmius tenuissimus]|uniref:Uncharacterized protein n=1 Tax=Marasmius tenuissimus TaxID=585030 RepID=A0ABR3A038_9AGAR|nr:hypothetical protein PM082_007898 [Marasmius tenuissimus]